VKRREFITLLGGSAFAWPLVARAQQPELIRRIGVLLYVNAEGESFQTELREGLRKFGYVDGKNIHFEVRSADGKLDLLPSLAAELVALKVDVIVALFTPSALAAKRATGEIPIIFLAGDAVGTGLVPNLARPAGNLTGLSVMGAELQGKCVELLHEMLPTVRRVAALGYAADPFSKPFVDQVQLAGRVTGIEIDPIMMLSGPDEIDAAFAAMEKARADAVVSGATFSTKHIADLALKHRLAAVTSLRSFAEAGGLMSYGYRAPALYRQMALFVHKVLQGNKPADIPVEQPSKFELVINLKTAKALGLAIPESFLLRADEVID
jgi:putative tryptophan/tyrosine transport system substrate-binding protein